MTEQNPEQITTFAQARERLESIVSQVKDKDLPLEQSLDLFEEAVRLGNRCSELIEEVGLEPGGGASASAAATGASAPDGDGASEH